jgi:hypothetical protein
MCPGRTKGSGRGERVDLDHRLPGPEPASKKSQSHRHGLTHVRFRKPSRWARFVTGGLFGSQGSEPASGFLLVAEGG